MNDTATMQRTFRHGIGVGTGTVCSTLRFFRHDRMISSEEHPLTADSEAERLEIALNKTIERIGVLRDRALTSVGPEEAEIFEIHAMLLEDDDFRDAMRDGLSEGLSAEQAVERAAERYSAILKGLDDPYLCARSADIRDIAEQLISILHGRNETDSGNEAKEPHILYADDLTPSETILLDRSLILGFVTAGGSSNSHTAILARAMGIPALVSVGGIDEQYNGNIVILNADEGTLLLSPGEDEIAKIRAGQEKTSHTRNERERYLRSLLGRPAQTKSGRSVLIYANVGDEREAEAALEQGADGIGLLRSEFLYLSLDRYPTEDELFNAYRAVTGKMKEKRTVIRTLDVGADKQVPYFDLPDEENPALGFRAVRICLAREDLFKTQLRAILRASAFGKTALMIPMIVSVDEIRQCKAILETCKKELRQENTKFDEDMEFGIMVETPSAAVMSPELAAEVDFFSVGTNDLTQYVLAADRQNPLLAKICRENVEPVLRLIRMAADAIHHTGGWIGICGELAADLSLTQQFADMGIDELSVSVPYLLEIRGKVTACE